MPIFRDGPMAALADRSAFARGNAPSVSRLSPTQEALSFTQLERYFGAVNNAQMGAGTYSIRDAYQLSPWMAPPIRVFAGAVAARTFEVHDGDNEVTKHPLLDLMARPNPTLRTSEYSLLYQTAALWRYSGEVFWQLEYKDKRQSGNTTQRPKNSFPSAIWLWSKDFVEPETNHSTGEFIGWWIKDGSSKPTFVDKLDMMHVPLFDPTKFNPRGPSRGTSLWESKRLPLTQEISAGKWNNSWFSRGIAPSIAVINKTQEPEGDEQTFIDKLTAKLTGSNRAATALFGDYEIVQLKPGQKDSEFTQGMDLAKKAILGGNTPPIAVGDQESNYANSQSQMLAWLMTDIIPSITFLASCITSTFFYDQPSMWTRFSTEDIDELQEGKQKRLKSYTELITARHSPKVASELVGIEVDPSMQGYGEVFIDFNKIPYDDAADTTRLQSGANPPPDPTPPPGDAGPPKEQTAKTPSEQATADAQAKADQGARKIRVLRPDGEIRVGSRVTAPDLDITGIITSNPDRLAKRAKPFVMQSVETGISQIGMELSIEDTVKIDDRRVIEFMAVLGSLFADAPRMIAGMITAKTKMLIDANATPKDIGRILRAEFNELSGWKAAQIGRQAVGSGLNAGRYIQMQEAGVTHREWVSSKDSKGRDSHSNLDGERVALNQKYSNGLRYPQDPKGNADAVDDCSCVDQPISSSRDRSGDWHRVVSPVVTATERRLAKAVGGVIHEWRTSVLTALIERGIAA